MQHATTDCSPGFGCKALVSFDPTTIALHKCALVGGFVHCFEAATCSLEKILTIQPISCTHCQHPLLDSVQKLAFPSERTCCSCLRTFPCPMGIVSNPLAVFLENTRVGARITNKGSNSPVATPTTVKGEKATDLVL